MMQIPPGPALYEPKWYGCHQGRGPARASGEDCREINTKFGCGRGDFNPMISQHFRCQWPREIWQIMSLLTPEDIEDKLALQVTSQMVDPW